MLGLLLADQKHDPSKGLHSFGAYARLWVQARLVLAVKRLIGPVAMSGKKNTAAAAALWGEEFEAEKHGEQVPEPNVDQQDGEALMAELVSVLRRARRRRPLTCDRKPDAIERDVMCFLRHAFGGEPFESIAADFGVSRQRVQQVFEQMWALFESYAAEVRDETT
jgi:DNA-directed RNA polymerase sigma subunit (sigma70/sigma32)